MCSSKTAKTKLSLVSEKTQSADENIVMWLKGEVQVSKWTLRPDFLLTTKLMFSLVSLLFHTCFCQLVFASFLLICSSADSFHPSSSFSCFPL